MKERSECPKKYKHFKMHITLSFTTKKFSLRHPSPWYIHSHICEWLKAPVSQSYSTLHVYRVLANCLASKTDPLCCGESPIRIGTNGEREINIFSRPRAPEHGGPIAPGVH